MPIQLQGQGEEDAFQEQTLEEQGRRHRPQPGLQMAVLPIPKDPQGLVDLKSIAYIN